MNSIYYEVFKLKDEPVTAKRILISTVIACFEALFPSGFKPACM